MSMDTFLDHPVSGPGVWSGQQMRQRNDWILHLSGSDITEIDQALTQVAASKKALFEITATDFRLPTLAPRRLATTRAQPLPLLRQLWRPHPPQTTSPPPQSRPLRALRLPRAIRRLRATRRRTCSTLPP
jgi:hypothetical protein